MLRNAKPEGKAAFHQEKAHHCENTPDVHGNAAMKHSCDSQGGSDLHVGGTATRNNSLFPMIYSIHEKNYFVYYSVFPLKWYKPCQISEMFS